MTNAQMVAEAERLAQKIQSGGFQSLTPQEQAFYQAAAGQAMNTAASQQKTTATRSTGLPGWVLPAALLAPIMGIAFYIATRP